mgnify:CR=1 FL=1
MYGQPDIYGAYDDELDEFGKFNLGHAIKRAFSKPGRAAAAILTGGMSETVKGKNKRLRDLEARIENIVKNLNRLHENDKMGQAQCTTGFTIWISGTFPSYGWWGGLTP